MKKQSYSTAISTKQQFNEVIDYLLSSNSDKSFATLGFIHQKIRQFHLDCDIHDVMNEVYLRGVKFIDRDGKIESPFGWVRGTALNVIREMSRRQKKVKVDSPLLDAYLDTTAIKPRDEEHFSKAEWTRLQSALADLKLDDQQILTLRWVKNLSWKEVAQNLSRNGALVKEGTARKRGGRALKRLRGQYRGQEQ